MKPFFTFEAPANRGLAWSNLFPQFLELETKITKQKKKEKKDPNKPKGALTAYMFYAKNNRERIVAENEGIQFGEVGKKCGEEWAALDAKDKKKYEDMNAEDKKRHGKEMEAYVAELSQITSPEQSQIQESPECVNDAETAYAETEELAEKQESKKTTKHKKKLLSGGNEVEPKTTKSPNPTRKQKITTTKKPESTVEDDDI
jgi:hypothetical protein